MAPLTPLRGVIPLLHGGGKLQTPIPTLTLGGTLKSQRGVGQVAPRHPDQHRKNHLDEVSVKAGRVFFLDFWIFGQKSYGSQYIYHHEGNFMRSAGI